MGTADPKEPFYHTRRFPIPEDRSLDSFIHLTINGP
jgi:hypothetical protein